MPQAVVLPDEAFMAREAWRVWLGKHEQNVVKSIQAVANVDTGQFKRSIRAVRRPGGDLRTPIVRIQSSDRVAVWIDAGTRPHIIRPKNTDGVLQFLENLGGPTVQGPKRTFYAKSVNHPGTKAYRPFVRGVEDYGLKVTPR